MNRTRDTDFENFDLEDDSDHEALDSSDDDIEILLHGTPEQKRKLHKKRTDGGSSSEDDFEREMNEELDGTVKAIEKRRGSLNEAGCSTSGQSTSNDGEPPKYYDDVYFDSDEEDMVVKGDAAVKRKHMSNDELLYDPDADEEDEKWVANQRRTYLNQKASTQQGKVKPLPHSDAVLNCPACMTILCLDCQRHDVYDHQYRAMFVRNCVVDKSEFLKYPKPKPKQREKKKKKNKKSVPEPDSENDNEEDRFHPVKCEECNTVVAVYDEDEVYHFFNVLSSY